MRLRPGLYALLDATHVAPDAMPDAAVALARAGVCALQIRWKGATGRALVDVVRAVRGHLADLAARPPLVVNDRADVALVAGADGVHLGQDDLSAEAARDLLGPDALIGLSTHDLEQVEAAAGAPVDYLGFGPVFPTATKAAPEPVTGLATLERACALAVQPVVAIGGLDAERMVAARRVGAHAGAAASALHPIGERAGLLVRAAGRRP